MLTVEDIKKLTQVFGTKQDLENLVTKQEFRDAMGKIMDRFDFLYGEVKMFRQEMTFLNNRVEKVEYTPTVASELKRKSKQ